MEEIHKILLIGGSTKIHFVNKMIEGSFGKSTFIPSNRETANAEGAAIYGASQILKGKEKIGPFTNIVIKEPMQIHNAAHIAELGKLNAQWLMKESQEEDIDYVIKANKFLNEIRKEACKFTKDLKVKKTIQNYLSDVKKAVSNKYDDENSMTKEEFIQLVNDTESFVKKMVPHYHRPVKIDNVIEAEEKESNMSKDNMSNMSKANIKMINSLQPVIVDKCEYNAGIFY